MAVNLEGKSVVNRDQVRLMIVARDFIEAMSHKYSVQNWKVDGVKIWPFIVFELTRLSKNIRAERANGPIGRSATLYKTAQSYLTSLYKKAQNARNVVKTRGHSDTVFLTQDGYHVKIEDAYYDRICDPIIDSLAELGVSSTKLSRSYSGTYQLPYYHESDLVNSELDLALLVSRLGTNNFVQTNLWENFDLFLDDLRRRGVDTNRFKAALFRYLEAMFELKKVYLKKLKIIQPKLAFLFPYYEVNGFAFILACRDLNIKTVDIQHGYFTESSTMYTTLGEYPECGYELLPDIFWCWNERDRERLLSWGINFSKHHEIFVGGNRWNYNWLESVIQSQSNANSSQNNAYSGCIEKVRSFKEFSPFKSHVLLTLSPYFQLEDWVLKAISTSENEICWWIRFHHRTTSIRRREYMATMGRFRNIELELSNTLPLPSIMAGIDRHLTFESSCIDDAKTFGLSSILLSQTGAKMFSEDLATGWAQLALTTEDLLAQIKSGNDNRKAQNCLPKDSSSVWVMEQFCKKYLRTYSEI